MLYENLNYNNKNKEKVTLDKLTLIKQEYKIIQKIKCKN